MVILGLVVQGVIGLKVGVCVGGFGVQGVFDVGLLVVVQGSNVVPSASVARTRAELNRIEKSFMMLICFR